MPDSINTLLLLSFTALILGPVAFSLVVQRLYDDTAPNKEGYRFMRAFLMVGLLAVIGLALAGCVGIGGKCDSKTPEWQHGITCW